MEIHKKAQVVLDVLNRNGFEAYVVGGCVRDSLMGMPPKDWDVCTPAQPLQVAACFKGKYPVFLTGERHGTVTIVVEGLPVEVTTYRTEGRYKDNRRPESVRFVTSLRQDLARRDFTINALAYTPQSGLVDYFGGLADIQKKRLACVGSADERLAEDGLRVMRALRFMAQLGFKADGTLAAALHKNRCMLQKIAAERIAKELEGILCGAWVRAVLYRYSDVLAVPLPEILPMRHFAQNSPYHCYDVWQHTVESIGAAKADKIIRFAMLLHDIGKPLCYTEKDGIGHFYGHAGVSAQIAEAVLRRLKMDNATVYRVTKLVKWHDVPLTPQNLLRWLNRLGEEGVRQLIGVKKADVLAQASPVQKERLQALEKIRDALEEAIAQKACFQLRDLALKGGDVIQAGVPEGPQVGKALKKLLDAVIEGEAENNKEALLRMLQTSYKNEERKE